MAYIGREPQVGNFQVCDAISVVNGQAAYTMQVSSVNVSPETANHMIVSLNGIIQAPGSSYTVSGSTITFASNLVTGDVINFIHILGSVLDLGTPSDDTVATSSLKANSVTAAKLNADIISGTTALAAEPADTDEFLVSDAGVLKRIDYSLIKGGGSWNLLSTTTVSSGVSAVDITSGIDSTYKNYAIIGNDLHPATDAEQIKVQVFSSQGSPDTGSRYRFATYGGQDNSGSLNLNRSDGMADHILIHANEIGGGVASEAAGFELFLYNPSGTTFRKYIRTSCTAETQTNPSCAYFGVGNYQDTAAITGVRIFMASGNIDNAVIKLYGIS